MPQSSFATMLHSYSLVTKTQSFSIITYSSLAAILIAANFMIICLFCLIFLEEAIKLGFCSFLYGLIFIGADSLLLSPTFKITSCKIRKLTFAFLIIRSF